MTDAQSSDDSDPFAEGENPFRSPAPTPSSPRPWQFSVRGLLATTAMFAVLFGILAALGIDALNTLLVLISTLATVAIGIGLVTLYWELTGGPRIRR
jgi:hypothetical protein